MFIGENRMKFVERICRAVHLRDSSESHLRFEAFLDGFGMENIQQPSDCIHERIQKLLSRFGEEFQDWIEFYKRKYTIVHQKFHAEMFLRNFIEKKKNFCIINFKT